MGSAQSLTTSQSERSLEDLFAAHAATDLNRFVCEVIRPLSPQHAEALAPVVISRFAQDGQLVTLEYVLEQAPIVVAFVKQEELDLSGSQVADLLSSDSFFSIGPDPVVASGDSISVSSSNEDLMLFYALRVYLVALRSMCINWSPNGQINMSHFCSGSFCSVLLLRNRTIWSLE